MPEPANIVIDISHHNGNPDFGQAAAAGIVGVIHKATQGLTYKDPMYLTNRQKATDAGLLWGAYHFGTGGDGSDQATSFLGSLLPTPAPCSCSTTSLTLRALRCRSMMPARS